MPRTWTVVATPTTRISTRALTPSTLDSAPTRGAAAPGRRTCLPDRSVPARNAPCRRAPAFRRGRPGRWAATKTASAARGHVKRTPRPLPRAPGRAQVAPARARREQVAPAPPRRRKKRSLFRTDPGLPPVTALLLHAARAPTGSQVRHQAGRVAAARPQDRPPTVRGGQAPGTDNDLTTCTGTSNTSPTNTGPTSTHLTNTHLTNTGLTNTGLTNTAPRTAPTATALTNTGPASTARRTAPTSTGRSNTGPTNTDLARTALRTMAPARTGVGSTALSSTAPARTRMSSTGPARTRMSSTAPSSTAPSSTALGSTALGSTAPRRADHLGQDNPAAASRRDRGTPVSTVRLRDPMARPGSPIPTRARGPTPPVDTRTAPERTSTALEQANTDPEPTGTTPEPVSTALEPPNTDPEPVSTALEPPNMDPEPVSTALVRVNMDPATGRWDRDRMDLASGVPPTGRLRQAGDDQGRWDPGRGRWGRERDPWDQGQGRGGQDGTGPDSLTAVRVPTILDSPARGSTGPGIPARDSTALDRPTVRASTALDSPTVRASTGLDSQVPGSTDLDTPARVSTDQGNQGRVSTARARGRAPGRNHAGRAAASRRADLSSRPPDLAAPAPADRAPAPAPGPAPGPVDPAASASRRSAASAPVPVRPDRGIGPAAP
jgi:hypothetical protein